MQQKFFLTRNEIHDILDNLEIFRFEKYLHGEFKKLTRMSWVSFLVKKAVVAFIQATV